MSKTANYSKYARKHKHPKKRPPADLRGLETEFFGWLFKVVSVTAGAVTLAYYFTHN